MLKTIVETKTVSEEDKQELERTWTDMKAMEELIKNGGTAEIIMTEYKKAFRDYNRQWAKIFRDYFTTDYSNVPGYEWGCDFETNIVTIKR